MSISALNVRRGWRTSALAGLALGLPYAAFASFGSTVGWSITDPAAISGEGNNGTVAADVNGDGFDDLVGVATGYNGGKGALVVRLGSAAGMTNPAIIIPANSGLEGFGVSSRGQALGAVGDINKDGFDDIAVGAPLNDAISPDQGRAYLYYGSANGLATTPAWQYTAAGVESEAHWGIVVAGAGDVNKDGFADFLVGADRNTMQGNTHLFLGSASGPVDSGWDVLGRRADDGLGSTVTSGDFNKDGYGDVVLGAPDGWTLAGLSGGGYVQLYLGSATALAASPAWTKEGAAEKVRFGRKLAAADFNGDGFSDLVTERGSATALEDDIVEFWNGAVLGLANTPYRTLQYAVADAMSGLIAADFDGDLRGDLAVAFQTDSAIATNSGRFDILRGDAGGISLIVTQQLYGTRANNFVGMNAVAGDFIGDGMPDLAFRTSTGREIFYNTADVDKDGVLDSRDNCPTVGNPSQADSDSDKFGDVCDNCPFASNAKQENFDRDAQGDACDADDDGDGVADTADKCPFDLFNDSDSDGICDSKDTCKLDSKNDGDGDGVCGNLDVCPFDKEDDSDRDGTCNSDDTCPGKDDKADADRDLVPDACDNCASNSNAVQADFDDDGVGDACDDCPIDSPDDVDSDGVCDSDDVCADQDDTKDADTDAVPDGCDNCQDVANAAQGDFDDDGEGDACDACAVENANEGVDSTCPAVDLCAGDDASGDADRDGTCDDLDACFGDDASGDIDADGACATRDGAVYDCDDDSDAISPDSIEQCNGRDDDCDGEIDPREVDEDGDGEAACEGDCDDSDDAVNSGAEEACNGVDDDCDGDVPTDEADEDEDGARICAGDCDDESLLDRPGAIESCDGVDNDCDDEIDDDCLGEVVEPPPVADDQGGCATSTGPSLAWILLLPLLTVRRRGSH